MKKPGPLLIGFLLSILATGGAQDRDTLPRVSFHVETGLIFSSLYFFSSHINPFTNAGSVEKDKTYSFSPSGGSANMGATYWFGDAFGVELNLMYNHHLLENKYKETHIIENLVFSEQEWEITITENFVHIPLLGILELDQKKRFTIGAGPYLKMRNLVTGVTKLTHTFYADEFLFLDEPDIHYIETEIRKERSTQFGWQVQAVWRIKTNHSNGFFLKVNYQRDFSPLQEKPYIHVQRLGVGIGYNLFFERDSEL